MLKPKRLEIGDCIAIVSLSSGIAGDKDFFHRYEIGKQRLENEFGLRTVTTPNALLGTNKTHLYPELRAKDMMNAFVDPKINAIISNIGGDDTVRLLPYIDFEKIKNNPKIFIGYSDTTINHFMLYKAGVVSFYGPSVMAEMAENVELHEYTKAFFDKMLFKDSMGVKIKPSPYWTSESLTWMNPNNNDIKRKLIRDTKGFETLQGKGKIEGVLIGGCIDTFHMFIGSDIWPRHEEWDDKILFLETSEDCPEPDFIAQLLRNPLFGECLKRIKGIIIGKPVDEKFYEEYKTMYMNVIGKEYGLTDLPIIYNYNFGHTAPMAILPIGIEVSIDCKNGEIQLLESATEEIY